MEHIPTLNQIFERARIVLRSLFKGSARPFSHNPIVIFLGLVFSLENLAQPNAVTPIWSAIHLIATFAKFLYGHGITQG